MEEQILAVDLSTEQTLEVNLPEQDNVAQIDVYWQDEVVLDLDASLMYIVSGQQEIQDYVENTSKPEIDDYIEAYAKPIVSEVVEEIAAPVVGDYIENTVKPEIKEFADAEMANYAQVAGEQATIATEKASEASETAKIVDEKVQEFSQTTEASKTEFVNFAQEKTEEFEQTAEQATEQAVGSAERSRIWAEGEQAEVELLGGELSSKGWALQASNSATSASQSATQAKTSEANAKSYADSIEPDRFLSKGTITNCITEIPQDIKLELNDGVLTLKAGSKVYVPNGFEADGVTPKFDVVVIESDFVVQDIPSNTVDFFMWDVKSQGLAGWPSVHCYSGDTRPTVSGQYAVWYDTKNNVYETKYGADTWSSKKYSLPICIATGNGTQFTSLDQVFNGFGYIGHTVWVSKGIKCLLPKGRNKDGTLKSLEYTTKFSLNTISTTSTSNGVIIINEPEEGERELYFFWDKAIHVGKNPPSDSLIASVTSYSAMAWFNPDENICRSLSRGSTAPYNWVEESSFVIVGKLFRDTANNNKIKELFITADATNLIKRSDSHEVSSWGMPSGKYIDLTLGATGTSYIAPASGWFCLVKKSTGGGQSIDMESNGLASQAISTTSGQAIVAFAPAAKGEKVVIYYTTSGATNRFRFIYAKGEI